MKNNAGVPDAMKDMPDEVTKAPDSTIIVTPDELLPLIRSVIESGAEFPLSPTGTSMLPTITEGRDTVTLAKPEGLRRGDIVLYRRPSGQIVLHRIIGRRGDTFIMCGDCEYLREYGITRDAVLAVVTSVCGRGRRVKRGTLRYASFGWRAALHRLVGRVRRRNEEEKRG